MLPAIPLVLAPAFSIRPFKDTLELTMLKGILYLPTAPPPSCKQLTNLVFNEPSMWYAVLIDAPKIESFLTYTDSKYTSSCTLSESFQTPAFVGLSIRTFTILFIQFKFPPSWPLNKPYPKYNTLTFIIWTCVVSE